MDLLKPGVTSGGLERVDHGDTAQDPLALVAGAADARAVRVAQPLRHPHCSHTLLLLLSPSRAGRSLRSSAQEEEMESWR